MTKVLIATEKPFAAGAVKQISAVLADAGFEYEFLEKYTMLKICTKLLQLLMA